MQFLYNDFLGQINPENEERKQITEEQKLAIQKLQHLNISLNDKNKMIDEILRFYSDLVETDLKLRTPEEVFRVCDNVLGKTAENLDDAINLLLEASSLREKKKTQGTKTKTTQVTPPTISNNENNNSNSISIETNVKQTNPPKTENQNKTKEKQSQPTKNTTNNNNNGSKKKNKQKNKQNNNPPPNKTNTTNNNNSTKKDPTISNTKKEEKTDPVNNNTNTSNNTPSNTPPSNNSNLNTPNPTNNTPSKINFNNMTKSELIKFKNEQDVKFESFLKQRKELALQMSKLEENISNLLNERNDMLNSLLNSK